MAVSAMETKAPQANPLTSKDRQASNAFPSRELPILSVGLPR
jgi:hypothetical protein